MKSDLRPGKHRGGTAWAVSVFAALGLAVCAVRTLDTGIPVPRVHDEFSYVLGAETFLAGRLTNPPHALARYFDTYHVVQYPTYQSKYPPAQAAVLALGWKIGGRPVYGIWLGFALMSASLCWMLLGWLPRSWALIAAASCVIWLGVTYWASSFWGGSVAAAGGAIVYGSLPRLQRQVSIGLTVTFGVGLDLLANSRPFEGLLVAVPAMIGVSLLLLDSRIPLAKRLTHLAVPLGIVGGFSVASIGVYNRAVTGRPALFPYVAYQRENDPVPVFIWQQPSKQTYFNPRRDAFRDWTLAYWQKQSGLAAAARASASRLVAALDFLTPLLFSFPLFVGLFVYSRASPWGYAAAGFALVCLGVVVSTWGQPHYIAPVVGPMVAVYFLALERGWSKGGRWRTLIRVVVVGAVAMWVLPPLGDIVAHLPGFSKHALTNDWSTARARLIDSLTADGRQHVVIVRYPERYSMHNEWVYNGANVDKQPVVWAHDMGSGTYSALNGYYPTRQILVLDPIDTAPYYRLSAASRGAQ